MRFFDYSKYAEVYAQLDITGTYYVAYRDLPKIIATYVKGRQALDYGCGTGRSTRFLKKLGFQVAGVDINRKMLNEAKKKDGTRGYYLIKSGDLHLFKDNCFDLILSAFTFDGIPSKDEGVKISKEMKRVLKDKGIIIHITSTPELYQHHWVSFMSGFPENKIAKSGDRVRIDVRGTNIKVYDYAWEDKDYREIFVAAGLQLVKLLKPLAKSSEPYAWMHEKKIAPWLVYVLKKAQ